MLSPDRPLSVGFGAAVIGEIPFPSICAFADRYGIDASSFDRFVRMLRLVDAASVSALNAKTNPGK